MNLTVYPPFFSLLSSRQYLNHPVFKQSDPIANNNPWTPSSDAASQISWQESVSAVLGREQLIQAGVFFGTDAFNSSELASNEQDAGTVNYIRSFSDHYYPQSSADANLSKLMDHADIGAGVAGFKGDVEAAKKLGKEFVFGETNSGTFLRLRFSFSFSSSPLCS